MQVTLLQRLTCLVLAVMMLGAVSHQGLCAAGMIECAPCQATDDGHENECPSCSGSLLITTTEVVKARQVFPTAQTLFPSFDLAKLMLFQPRTAETQAGGMEETVPAWHDHLQDLRRSIPIRAPSLTA